ncbi:MAG: hypothetical protein ACYC06_02940 [Ilumatobacteraceae bacterium]
MSEIPPPPFPRPVTQLTRTWRNVTAASWLVLGLAVLALAISSRTLGKPTWWLGPQSNPRFIALWATPFLAPIASIIASLRFSRWATQVSLISSVALAIVAVFDLRTTPGVAVGEFILAGAGVLITLASLAGRTTVNTYRQPQ